MSDLRARLEVAEAAARDAGRLLREEREAQARVTCEPLRDIKLRGDVEAERLIVERLRADSDNPVLSEEAGLIGGGETSDGLRWIVDPLDGSVNYLRGLPFCSVSVGLWDGDRPLLGCVYDFNRDEMFTGLVGEGAWVNGAPVRASDTTERARAVLCTGFPAATDFSAGALAAFVEQVREFKKVRLLGSAALSLACVAAGRADAYVERNINLWDVAAGAALVLAAGGVLVCVPAADGWTLTVYAGGAKLPPLAVE